jgi:hypothetical protein
MIFNPPSEFDDTRSALAEFDPLAVATAVAALHVVPGNAGAIWRLEVMSGLAAAQPRRPGQRALDSASLRRMLTEGGLASAASMAEDPFEELLTEEIAFHGGSHLVGAGISIDSMYALRLLLRGFLLSGALPGELAREVRELATAALLVSDLALRRAGLDRNVLPEGTPRQLVVPDEASLSELQRAMAFRVADLQNALPHGNVGALEPLTVDLGSQRFSDAELRDGAQDRWPLLRHAEWIVLARPFGVCTAVRHRMALRAVEEIGAEAATALFGASVDDDVADALRRMTLRPRFVRRRDADTAFSEIHARCDSDKFVAALVLSDDFRGLNERSPYTSFDVRAHVDAAHAHLEALATRAAEDGDQVLGLIVGQAAGRTVFVGTDREQAPNLTLKGTTAADLDVIAFLESGDPLALWKFARAPRVLERMEQMTMFSPLDGYGTYRDNERSFAPFREATSLMVAPGSGADYRREARAARDRHGAPDVSGNVREVEHEHPEEARRGALYYSLEMIGEGTVARFVDDSPVGLWAVGPQGDIDVPLDVIDTVAYWLAELREAVHGFLTAFARTLRCLQFEVRFEDRAFWLDIGPDPGSRGAGGVEVVGRGAVRLTLGAEIKRLVPANDNAADRLLVGLLVDAIVALAGDQGVGGVVTEAERAAIVDAVAPLGVKKHLLSFAADEWPMMEPVGGRARTVQEADLTGARFGVAEHLRAAFGYRNEEIPHERRNDVLHSAVEFLFGEIRRVINGVSPDGALESLMTANERLIADSERRRAILAAREATYPASGAELRDEVARANQAAVCCRFLVEYVAARPPSGGARWSTARYDEALAAAAELVDWGNLSDAIHGELTTMDLLVRDDGQLRLVEYDRYETGRGAYFDVYVEEERERSRRRFVSTPRSSTSEDSTLPLRRLDPYVEAEAGVKLTELGEMLVAANLVARELDVEVVALARAEAVAALDDILEWGGDASSRASRIRAGIAYLAMGPRANFLAPPAGKAPDTYPWLFARRWSYNRRPFVVREGDVGEEILWGRRHVVQAMQILIGQMTGGRYQALAETSALRRELGRLARQEGATFESEVASVLHDDGRLAVARRVGRLGEERIEREPGQSLGDIDILAGDVSTRTLWALECKDLSGAMTAAEIAREMSEHFRAIGSTSMTKHAERVAWLEARIPAALERLELNDAAGEWLVRGLFVTGRPVHAPYIEDVAIQIVPLNRLVEHLRGGA